jgi:ElaA protein
LFVSLLRPSLPLRTDIGRPYPSLPARRHCDNRKHRMPEITTQWRRFEDLSANDLYELLNFRQSIFVVEQRSPYPDLDGLDQAAWHLSARLADELAGYLRVIARPEPPTPIRIGRVAVAPRLRRWGIGRQLMREALRLCRDRYPFQPIALGAQLYLLSFYESLGFTAVSEIYDDFEVAHVEMMLKRQG